MKTRTIATFMVAACLACLPAAAEAAWFQLLPPKDKKGNWNTMAPLSAWKQAGSFETQRKCEDDLMKTTISQKDGWEAALPKSQQEFLKSERGAKQRQRMEEHHAKYDKYLPPADQLLLGQCVSGDDPRLRSK